MPASTIKLGEVENACSRAIEFLFRSQLVSGEFKTFFTVQTPAGVVSQADSSPFPAALIVQCLMFSKSSVSEQIMHRATQFLLSEMEGGGLWRYFSRRHPSYSHSPIDLDDTSYASSVLLQRGVRLADNQALMLKHRNSDGLFYTWIIPRFRISTNFLYWKRMTLDLARYSKLSLFFKLYEAEPNDVDAVVNANVLHYLGHSKSTNSVIEYLIRIIEEGKETNCDKWHLSRFNLYYFLSRNYFAGMERFSVIRATVIERIESFCGSDGLIGEHVLDTALAVCSLFNFRSESEVVERAIERLLITQNESGAWSHLPLYYGGPKRIASFGSEELTTGFCVEALSRYLSSRSRKLLKGDQAEFIE